MASSYTPLGIELQATGENAGTWGTKTNVNLQLIEQIVGGYTAQSIAGGAQTTALSISDSGTGDVAGHRIYRHNYRKPNCYYTFRCTNFLYFKKFNFWFLHSTI